MFQTKILEKIKRHFLFNNILPEYRTAYEIMWENMVERGRPQITIWRMGIACWLSKAIDTHSEYLIRIAYSQQHWLRERASMLCLYVHCLSCLKVQ